MFSLRWIGSSHVVLNYETARMPPRGLGPNVPTFHYSSWVHIMEVLYVRFLGEGDTL
jgi:hypothetical protein